MKRLFAVLLVLTFVATPFVLAEGPAAPAPVAKEKPDLKEVTVNGTLTKEDEKNAKGEMTTDYIVTDSEGTRYKLPKQKDKEQAATAALVGKNVTLVAKGTDDGGKFRVKKIVSLAENNPDEAAAPAATPAATK